MTDSEKVKDVTFIVDKSGSMSACREQVIAGYNDFVRGMRDQSDLDIRLTLSFFDTRAEVRHEGVPIAEVPALDIPTYVPSGGTALYDALGLSIRALEKRWQGSEAPTILVVVMTDGEENSSREFTKAAIRTMIDELDRRPNWTFVYLGANQDSWAEAQKIGYSFSADNHLNYQPHQTQETMREVTTSASVLFRSGSKKSGDFFQKGSGGAAAPPSNPYVGSDPTRKKATGKGSPRA